MSKCLITGMSRRLIMPKYQRVKWIRGMQLNIRTETHKILKIETISKLHTAHSTTKKNLIKTLTVSKD